MSHISASIHCLHEAAAEQQWRSCETLVRNLHWDTIHCKGLWFGRSYLLPLKITQISPLKGMGQAGPLQWSQPLPRIKAQHSWKALSKTVSEWHWDSPGKIIFMLRKENKLACPCGRMLTAPVSHSVLFWVWLHYTWSPDDCCNRDIHTGGISGQPCLSLSANHRKLSLPCQKNMLDDTLCGFKASLS